MGASMGKNGHFLDALPSQSTMHVVMLGLDSAGKTTALYRLKFDQYLNTVPTIGFNCEKIQGTIGKAKGVQFLVWDVGGQEKLRPLWRSYTRCTDGILFVVDSVDVERMEEAKMELMRTAKCPDNQGVPVLILANKQDLPNARDPKELEKLLGLHELQYPTVSCQFASMSSTASSSTGNIVGCTTSNSQIAPSGCTTSNSQTAPSGGSSQTHKRSLTPTAQHQKSFEFASCGVSKNDATISASSTSLLTGNCDESLAETTSTSSTFLNKDIAAAKTKKHAPANVTTGMSAGSVTTLQFKGWYIQPACAITGEGLQEGLEALHEMILKRRKLNKACKKQKR